MMGMIYSSAHVLLLKVWGFEVGRGVVVADGINPLPCPSTETLVTLGWKGAEVVTAVFPARLARGWGGCERVWWIGVIMGRGLQLDTAD